MTVTDPLWILPAITTTKTYGGGLCTVVTTVEYHSRMEPDELTRQTTKVTRCGPFSFVWRDERIVSNPYFVSLLYGLYPEELQPSWSVDQYQTFLKAHPEIHIIDQYTFNGSNKAFDYWSGAAPRKYQAFARLVATDDGHRLVQVTAFYDDKSRIIIAFCPDTRDRGITYVGGRGDLISWDAGTGWTHEIDVWAAIKAGRHGFLPYHEDNVHGGAGGGAGAGTICGKVEP